MLQFIFDIFFGMFVENYEEVRSSLNHFFDEGLVKSIEDDLTF